MNPQPSIASGRARYRTIRVASSAATLIEDRYTCSNISLSGEGTDTYIVWVHNESFLSSEPYFYLDTRIAPMYGVGVQTSPYVMRDVGQSTPGYNVYTSGECKSHKDTFALFDHKDTLLALSSSSSMPDAEDSDLRPMGPLEVTQRYGERLHTISRTTREQANVEEAVSIVADAFAQFSEVGAIYIQRWRSELQFVVLLDIEKYDSDLINRLLDVEYELLKHEDEGLLWDFAYLPCKGRDNTEVVSSSATVVFSR